MTTLTKKQINWLNKCTKVTWTLNQTGLVDVKGNFDCSGQGLTDFKGVRFGKVDGDFYCYDNQLTSLVGAPKTVGVNFDCEDNQLTSLVGAPQEVKGYFVCNNNQLTSLVGAPQEVVGNFDCDDNPVSEKTLKKIYDKMKKGDSFMIAAASLRNEMSKKDWKLIAKHIPEAIRPGVSMLARFGLFK